MKRLFTLLTLFCWFIASFAYDVKVDGIYYNLNNEEMHAYVTSEIEYYGEYVNHNSYSGQIVIPETITVNDLEYTVTRISECAFSGCPSVTSVFLPETITYICRNAFGSSPITSINLPSKLLGIDWDAFAGSKLESLTIPNSLTYIGDYAFWYCTSLTNLIIPNTVTFIGGWAFACCSALSNINIPNSVTEIQTKAFDDCGILSSVVIPESVTTIGENVFGNCYIKKECFENYSNFSPEELGITFYDQETEDGLLIRDNIVISCRPDVSSVIIPSDVTGISDFAFSNQRKLTSVFIPESVEFIGYDAFSGCESLKSIIIPQSVSSIGQGVFRGCYFQADNFVNNTNFEINYFGGTLCEIEAEDGLLISNNEIIKCRPFSTSASIPNGITNIRENAFCNCSNLKNIVIPNSVTTIGEHAFSGCSNLESIIIPNSVTTIGEYAFSYCASIENINIPNSVSFIGNNAFSDCPNLVTLIYDEGCTKTVKTNITSLKFVEIPSTVISIEERAFEGCESLLSINIPNSVVSIGNRAFSGCTAFRSITIPQSVAIISVYAFQNCSNLEKLIYEEGCTNTIGTGITSVKEVIIPSSVTSITAYAFSGCKNLTSIIIPDNVTEIGTRAFYNCSALTEITIPKAVTDIGDEAFRYCSNLASISLSEGITKIGNYAFDNCSKLTSITLSSNIKTIGTSAFSGCTALTEMTCERSRIPNTADNIFARSGYENGTLYVPADAIDKYESAFPWYGWGDIKSIDEKKPEPGDKGICEAPVITLANGKLTITSATPGARCYYTLKAEDAADDKVIEGEISLSTLYTISAYAVAEGYGQSETVRKTVEIAGDINGDGNITVSDVTLLVNKVLEQEK